MKKTLAVIAISALIAGAFGAPAEAAKKKKRVTRTVEYAYTSPSPGVPGVVGACLSVIDPTLGSGCIDIAIAGTEKFVNVEVVDASGTPSHVILAQDTDAAQPGFEIFAEFCGTSDGAIAVTPGLPLRVSVYGSPSPQCAAVGTSGSITAVLSNLP